MEKHELIKRYIEGLARNLNTSLMVVGSAGTGKTESVVEMLISKGYKEGIHYTYVSNYITPVELFLLLQEVNKLQDPKILVLDDIEDTLRNERAIGLLKGALWEVNGRRRVMWRSGTWRIVEKQFEFQGRVIFLLNYLNEKSAVVRALQDRSLFYEIELSSDEVAELILQRAKEKPYKDMSIEQREKVASFVIENGKKSTHFSLRMLPKAFNMFILSPQHWEKLVLQLL